MHLRVISSYSDCVWGGIHTEMINISTGSSEELQHLNFAEYKESIQIEFTFDFSDFELLTVYCSVCPWHKLTQFIT